MNGLNLDVTTMMAYVASSTNGGCYASLSSHTLSIQLENERKNHVKQILDDLFEGLSSFLDRNNFKFHFPGRIKSTLIENRREKIILLQNSVR